MRYKRPSCEECIWLASEKAAFYLAYQDAREALKLTPKNDAAYGERAAHLKKVAGQWGEARKRERGRIRTSFTDRGVVLRERSALRPLAVSRSHSGGPTRRATRNSFYCNRTSRETNQEVKRFWQAKIAER